MSGLLSTEVTDSHLTWRGPTDHQRGTATSPNRLGVPFHPESPAAVHESESTKGLRGAESSERAWVVAVGGHVVGALRLERDGKGGARVRCVRIDPEWQHTSVPESLADRARAFCRHAGYSRVAFAPGSAPLWFQAMARRRGLTNLD